MALQKDAEVKLLGTSRFVASIGLRFGLVQYVQSFPLQVTL